MKTPMFLLVLAVVAGSFLTSAPRALADDNPRMRAAIDLLQEAKKSDNPIPLLEQAKKRLRNSRGNKGGSRVDAVQELNEAIEVARTGNKDKTNQKINRVISEIHSGIDKSK